GIGTLHRDDDIAFASVGRPVGAGKNIRISSEGEILVDAAHCFNSYYKDEESLFYSFRSIKVYIRVLRECSYADD
ncbi:hypothetical protein LCGC14_1425170, partial [marine sediment metagenome]